MKHLLVAFVLTIAAIATTHAQNVGDTQSEIILEWAKSNKFPTDKDSDSLLYRNGDLTIAYKFTAGICSMVRTTKTFSLSQKDAAGDYLTKYANMYLQKAGAPKATQEPGFIKMLWEVPGATIIVGMMTSTILNEIMVSKEIKLNN